MTDVRPGGSRRIDRVLAADYLTGLATRPLPEVRTLRDEAEQEEVDLSYLRRMLHGRIDIVRAEQRRRAAGDSDSIMAQLPQILGGDERRPARGLGRLDTREPTDPDRHRRYVEALVADVDLSDVVNASDGQLTEALAAYLAEERSVSDLRRRVQAVVDALGAEVTRRYQDGEADVARLLEEDR
ncbi:MAG TPA: aerial mycelium formation protein [Mycobacteriales bacterium]|nr:aerial mycelium formation protein [Mycobacteriales bacterium]